MASLVLPVAPARQFFADGAREPGVATGGGFFVVDRVLVEQDGEREGEGENVRDLFRRPARPGQRTGHGDVQAWQLLWIHAGHPPTPLIT